MCGGGAVWTSGNRKISVVMGWCAIMILVMTGCERGEAQEDRSHLQEPYQITAVDIEHEGTAYHWAADSEQVDRWVNRAFEESDQGISRTQSGMEMRATIHYEVRLDGFGERSRLVVEVDGQAERNIVENGEPMIMLSARSEYRHPLSQGTPSDGVLRALSRTMKRQAIEDVVTQLRLRAQIRQSDATALAGWIRNSAIDKEERLYAIRRAFEHLSPEIDDALVMAADAEHDEVAVAAARALYARGSDWATYALMDVAQRMSRDQEYERYLGLLSLLGELDAPWVSIYLETVADAHRLKRVRDRAQTLIVDRPPVVDRF